MSISHSAESEEEQPLRPIVATTQHSTTITSRPWPGIDSVGLYGYYYCGVDEAVSFGDLKNTKTASFANWKMIVTIGEQDCSTNDKCLLKTKCIGIALDQQTVFTRASCIQQPGILGENALIESPNVKIYETRSSDLASAVQIQHYFYKDSYNTSTNYGALRHNDLMIIKTKVKMWRAIPACLPDPMTTPTNATKCWIVGVREDQMYQVAAEFIPDCEHRWTAIQRLDTESQFCAKAQDPDIPFCEGDAALLCEFPTKFGENKIIIFGVLVYHVYRQCNHHENYFVFNRLSTQFRFLCCTQENKYAGCKYHNCDDPPKNHPNRGRHFKSNEEA